MVILRATQKLLRHLLSSIVDPAVSDTALGDWYVNRLVVDRRPLLLFVSSRSLLSILTPARDIPMLPDRLPVLVHERLRRFGITEHLIGCELNAMQPVWIGKTMDRSVLGVLVEFAKTIPTYLPKGNWTEADLRLAEDRLAETPCHAGRRFEEVIFPDRDVPRLLQSTWPMAPTRH